MIVNARFPDAHLEDDFRLYKPPILTVTPQDQYIILDGANRCYSFQALQLPFILVQIVHYGQNVSLRKLESCFK
jgi:hypothetical protein